MKLNGYEMRTREKILNDASDPEINSTQEGSPLMLVLETMLDIREILLADYQLRKDFLGDDDGEEENELKRLLESVPEGQRREVMFSIALRVRARLENQDMLLQQMALYNAQYCKPPLPEGEIESIVSTVYEKDIGEVINLVEEMRNKDERTNEGEYSPSDRRRG